MSFDRRVFVPQIGKKRARCDDEVNAQIQSACEKFKPCMHRTYMHKDGCKAGKRGTEVKEHNGKQTKETLHSMLLAWDEKRGLVVLGATGETRIGEA